MDSALPPYLSKAYFTASLPPIALRCSSGMCSLAMSGAAAHIYLQSSADSSLLRVPVLLASYFAINAIAILLADYSHYSGVILPANFSYFSKFVASDFLPQTASMTLPIICLIF